jgi:outer membrane receptor protein involved in Fe transport
LPGNLSALGLTTSQFNGKQIDRLPDVQVHFQPTFHFNRRGSVYVSVDYVGRRFGDLANTLQLNSYVMFGAGVSYRPLKNLTLSLSGTNLTNKLAFDVGNPRGGSNLSAGTGPIFARALLGTQAKFTATLTF